jgi:hypothetical protein
MGLGAQAQQGKPSARTAEEVRDSSIVDERIGWRLPKLDRIRGARSKDSQDGQGRVGQSRAGSRQGLLDSMGGWRESFGN